jgi:hypothetical protein
MTKYLSKIEQLIYECFPKNELRAAIDEIVADIEGTN